MTAVYVASGVTSDARISEVLRAATETGCEMFEVSRSDLDAISAGQSHLGIAIATPPFAYADVRDVAEEARDKFKQRVTPKELDQVRIDLLTKTFTAAELAALNTPQTLRVFRITATACNGSGGACPDAGSAAQPLYVERQRLAIAYCPWNGTACISGSP